MRLFHQLFVAPPRKARPRLEDDNFAIFSSLAHGLDRVGHVLGALLFEIRSTVKVIHHRAVSYRQIFFTE